MKRATIFGCTGQDGSYLSELLLSKGYSVHGTMRRSSSFNTGRIDHIFDQLNMHFVDLADSNSIQKVLKISEPDEIYILSAQSHVRVSFDIPEYTCDIDALGVLRVLEAVKDINPKIRVYNAASSEMFGKVTQVPQDENTPFHPRSPYGIAKLFSYWTTVNYREAYGIHASNGILFNHESPRRGETFVSRKITKAAARIKLGLQDTLLLGNLDAKRDWGYAKDYVEAMWLMLQQEQPGDYVVATGETHTIRDFLDSAFGYLGLDWTRYVGVDPKYYRPSEVDILQGNAWKAKHFLGWQPKVRFRDLVHMMVDSDLTKETQNGKKQ